MYNLFMTVLILIFLLVAYLYYKVTKAVKETFQNEGNIIDLSGQINIPGFNTRVNINETIQNLQTADLSGSTAYGRDLLLKNETQCELFKTQIINLENRLELYRSQGDFTNLRISYEIIESIKKFMKENNCPNG